MLQLVTQPLFYFLHKKTQLNVVILRKKENLKKRKKDRETGKKIKLELLQQQHSKILVIIYDMSWLVI